MENSNSKFDEEKWLKKLLNYSFIEFSFHSLLSDLKQINETLSNYNSELFESKKQELLDKTAGLKVPKENSAIVEKILKGMKEKDLDQIKNNMDQLSPPALEFFVGYMALFANKVSTEKFLREMTIAYLITTFEDFFKKILTVVYFSKPESLSSDDKINFKQIIELKDYDRIIQTMVQRKTKEIIDKPIDELGVTLEKDFNFSLVNDTNWTDFAEVFFRRHVIVHNNSLADDKYKEKINNQNANDLSPSPEYVMKSIQLFREYSTKIVKFFNEKYPVQS